jgi:hypothetical protein
LLSVGGTAEAVPFPKHFLRALPKTFPKSSALKGSGQKIRRGPILLIHQSSGFTTCTVPYLCFATGVTRQQIADSPQYDKKTLESADEWKKYEQEFRRHWDEEPVREVFAVWVEGGVGDCRFQILGNFRFQIVDC